MSGSSNIEWTDATWNPVTGCSRVSAGCDHCYAVAMTHRLQGASLGLVEGKRNSALGARYAGLTVVNAKGDRHFNGKVRCHEDVLEWPLKKRKPLRIFVNSMSDLFHEQVPFEFIDKVAAVMALCPQHTFQILTKRPERMAEYLATLPMISDQPDRLTEVAHTIGHPAIGGLCERPLPNVWLGTSVEDQATADKRIPHLLRCPAAVRFLSVEPMLGPVNLRNIPFGTIEYVTGADRPVVINPLEQWRQPRLNWIIVGGESGPGARPMHPDWVRSVRDQCQAAGVPFFFKQWGNWIPDQCMFCGHLHWVHKAKTWVNGGTCLDATGKTARCGADFEKATYPVAIVRRVGKKTAGAMLDGREWREFPR